jgi:Fe-S-cluster containining protein
MGSCLNCGKCCISFGVCVSEYDVELIVKNTGLSEDVFVQYIPNYDSRERKEKAVLINGKKMLRILKWKSNPDVFLDNEHVCFFYNEKEKRCDIHSFRPRLCRTYPFKLNEKKELIETQSRACPKKWFPVKEELNQYKKDIEEYEKNL